MKFARISLATLLAVLIAGLYVGLTVWSFTNQDRLIEKFAPADEVAIGRQYIDLLRSKKISEIETTLDPTVKNSATRSAIERAAALFPAQAPRRTKLVGYHWDTSNSETNYDVAYELVYRHTWLFIVVSFKKNNDGIILESAEVQPLTDSLEHMNALNSGHKRLGQYLMALTTLAVGVFVIATLFICARTPTVRHKWLWMILICIGVVQFSMNWTTGEYSVEILSFHVPASGMSQAGSYSPWMFFFTVPAGAVVFLLRRGRLMQSKEPAVDVVPLATSGTA